MLQTFHHIVININVVCVGILLEHPFNGSTGKHGIVGGVCAFRMFYLGISQGTAEVYVAAKFVLTGQGYFVNDRMVAMSRSISVRLA